MRQDLKIIDTRCIKSLAAVGGTACLPAVLYLKQKPQSRTGVFPF